MLIVSFRAACRNKWKSGRTLEIPLRCSQRVNHQESISRSEDGKPLENQVHARPQPFFGEKTDEPTPVEHLFGVERAVRLEMLPIHECASASIRSEHVGPNVGFIARKIQTPFTIHPSPRTYVKIREWNSGRWRKVDPLAGLSTSGRKICAASLRESSRAPRGSTDPTLWENRSRRDRGRDAAEDPNGRNSQATR